MKTKLLLILITCLFLNSCSEDDDSGLNCFSPTQNLTIAYETDSIGCDCDSDNDSETCVPDENGRNVALICSDNKWIAVEDGPCIKIDDNNNSNCFSPTQNLTIAYETDSIGCVCDSDNDNETCVPDENGRNVALICSDNKWIAVEDGPCSQIQ